MIQVTENEDKSFTISWDETSPTLKYYDGADDISLATIDHSANTVNWLFNIFKIIVIVSRFFITKVCTYK